MKNKKKNNETDRILELSGMLLEMGQSLMKEGIEKNSYSIKQSGSFLIFMGSIILSEKDLYEFNELILMFSAKKILESMEKNNNPLLEQLKKKSKDETYNDFIKRINKLRGDLGHEPLG